MPLHHKQMGQGEPILLIHGLFGSLENLGGIARLLSERFSVFSIDLPNHGRSPHTDSIDLESMADKVLASADELGLSSFSVFGHSLGGKVGMEIALRHSERLQKLVVADIAPVHYSPHHSDVFKGLLAVDTETLSSRKQADEILQKHVPELPVRSFLLKNLVKQAEGGFAWRMNLPIIHKHYSDLIKGNSSGRFDGPVLFLKGGNSDYIKPEYREQTLALFPQAAVKVVANTGHWLHAEKPELIAKLSSSFLAS